MKSGPQPICAYALNVGPGADRLLDCKDTAIPVAIAFSNLRATAKGVRVRIACAWPAGTQCPGQLALRTKFRVAVPSKRGRPVRIRTITRSLGRRAFRLTGERSHAFTIPFTAGGRALVQQRDGLKAQLIAAIPGGRRVAVLALP